MYRIRNPANNRGFLTEIRYRYLIVIFRSCFQLYCFSSSAKLDEEVRKNWELLARGRLELEPGLEASVRSCPRKHLGLR